MPEWLTEEWLTQFKLPIGNWLKSAVGVLETNAQGFFDLVALVIEALVDGLTAVLLFFPPLILIALFAAGAYALHRSWRLVALVVISLLLVANLGYWKPTMETLSLVIIATLVCVVIGVPIGIAAAHRPWLYQALRPILDLMQTIPTCTTAPDPSCGAAARSTSPRSRCPWSSWRSPPANGKMGGCRARPLPTRGR